MRDDADVHIKCSKDHNNYYQVRLEGTEQKKLCNLKIEILIFSVKRLH